MGPFLPPKKKYKKVPFVVFGKLKGLAWGVALQTKSKKQPNVRQTKDSHLTQESLAHKGGK